MVQKDLLVAFLLASKPVVESLEREVRAVLRLRDRVEELPVEPMEMVRLRDRLDRVEGALQDARDWLVDVRGNVKLEREKRGG